MIQREPWYQISQRIEDGGPEGTFSAVLVFDEDTGRIDIGIGFRIGDAAPHWAQHETAVRIRAQVVNEIILTYLIIRALTKYALCVGCEVFKETAPIVYDVYEASRKDKPELSFKERTGDVVNRLKDTAVVERATKAAIAALAPCARDIGRNPA